MSDDTPTERFPANDPADDAPTQRLPQVPPAGQQGGQPAQPPAEPAWTPIPNAFPTERLTPATPPTTPPPGAGQTRSSTLEPDKSKAPLYWLIGVGAALLVALIILLIVLFGGGDNEDPVANPTDSATPSVTPTPSETPTPEAPEPEPEETVAPPPAPTGPTFATFSAPSSADCQDGEEQIPLTFSWSSTNAARAYIGVQTTNAKDSPFASDLPPTHTFTDISYNCEQDSQVYTVTLEDDAGMLAHETVTITR